MLCFARYLADLALLGFALSCDPFLASVVKYYEVCESRPFSMNRSSTGAHSLNDVVSFMKRYHSALADSHLFFAGTN